MADSGRVAIAESILDALARELLTLPAASSVFDHTLALQHGRPTLGAGLLLHTLASREFVGALSSSQYREVLEYLGKDLLDVAAKGTKTTSPTGCFRWALNLLWVELKVGSVDRAIEFLQQLLEHFTACDEKTRLGALRLIINYN